MKKLFLNAIGIIAVVMSSFAFKSTLSPSLIYCSTATPRTESGPKEGNCNITVNDLLDIIDCGNPIFIAAYCSLNKKDEPCSLQYLYACD